MGLMFADGGAIMGMHGIKAAALAALISTLGVFGAAAESREGWEIRPTAKSYSVLLTDLKAAVTANKMGLVTEAGPTQAAKKRLGVVIAGNRVVGVFRPDFAVRILKLSEAAMIEAPIRFYVTEQPNGKATLSYKTPSFVFGAYADEGGAELAQAAAELDAIFAKIAEDAVK